MYGASIIVRQDFCLVEPVSFLRIDVGASILQLIEGYSISGRLMFCVSQLFVMAAGINNVFAWGNPFARMKNL
jgi:hypothetical protein